VKVEVVPLALCNKSCLQKKGKHIHRKVKCAHLVPEPDSRWLDHVVPGSKKKNSTKPNKHIHRKMKCAHLVSEPDSRWLDHVVLGSKENVPNSAKNYAP
jgi:hypothetical protein